MLAAQSCLLPESIENIRPERCAIRYIQPDPQGVKVILEFEKQGRILAPHVINKQRNGIKTSLRGIYELLFDPKGALLSESRKYLQSGNVPADCNVFGLGDQQYQKLEEGLSFISDDEYDQLPWFENLTGEQEDSSTLENVSAPYFESTAESLPNNTQLSRLLVIKHQREQLSESWTPTQSTVDLTQYDSATKKAYWMAPFEGVTNPINGDFRILLCKRDKKMDKHSSSKIFRVVTFDTMGLEKHKEDLNFEYPMDLMYAYQHYSPSDQLDSHPRLSHSIFMFRHQDVDADINPKLDFETLHYYVFSQNGHLDGSGIIAHQSKEARFDPIHHEWTSTGLLFWHHEGYKITTSHLSFGGSYQVHRIDDHTPLLRDLVRSRSAIHKPITIGLYENPVKIDHNNLLYIYRVFENISIGQSRLNALDINQSGTMLNHGLLTCTVSHEGRPHSVSYYQRPEDADPQAPLVIGNISLNHNDVRSFCLEEITSDGVQPVLIQINGTKIVTHRANTARPVSRQIYYDPTIPLAAFFAKVPNPRDLNKSFRTIEILQVNQGGVDMSGLDPAFRK